MPLRGTDRQTLGGVMDILMKWRCYGLAFFSSPLPSSVFSPQVSKLLLEHATPLQAILSPLLTSSSLLFFQPRNALPQVFVERLMYLIPFAQRCPATILSALLLFCTCHSSIYLLCCCSCPSSVSLMGAWACDSFIQGYLPITGAQSGP